MTFKFHQYFIFELPFSALLSLLNFLASNDSYLGLRAYYLCLRIMVILNLFITYGDTFLPTDVAYDYMCYEILRRQSVFHKVLNKAMRIRDQHQDNEQYLMTYFFIYLNVYLFIFLIIYLFFLFKEKPWGLFIIMIWLFFYVVRSRKNQCIFRIFRIFAFFLSDNQGDYYSFK